MAWASDARRVSKDATLPGCSVFAQVGDPLSTSAIDVVGIRGTAGSAGITGADGVQLAAVVGRQACQQLCGIAVAVARAAPRRAGAKKRCLRGRVGSIHEKPRDAAGDFTTAPSIFSRRSDQTLPRMISAGARPARNKAAIRCMAGAEWLKKRL